MSAALLLACVVAVSATPSSAAAVVKRRAAHHRHRRYHRYRRAGTQAASTENSTCANANTPATVASSQAMDVAVVCLVNQQRAERGLPTLREQLQLDGAAQQWTNWMVSAGDFTDGANFAGRLAAVGYVFRAAAENVATGALTPSEAVSAWMASAPHCRNILTPIYRDVGTGVSPRPVRGTSSVPATWTQDFGLSIFETAPSDDWGPADGCPY